MGIRDKYEAHHKCRYTEDAIKAAVHLSSRYIVDRYLPDKAIDLIDEAGSKASIEAFKMKKEQNNYILSKDPEDYWREIRTVQSTLKMVMAWLVVFPLLFALCISGLQFKLTSLQVQESKLKYYGASGIEDTGELILDSYLTSAAIDTEYVS
jgi:ATP-dependent Clp protease ATP-binding subunit ClpC